MPLQFPNTMEERKKFALHWKLVRKYEEQTIQFCCRREDIYDDAKDYYPYEEEEDDLDEVYFNSSTSLVLGIEGGVTMDMSCQNAKKRDQSINQISRTLVLFHLENLKRLRKVQPGNGQRGHSNMNRLIKVLQESTSNIC
ncbi:uncharacterized protein LOC122292343 [Carya illinoinensis]|uniref:uncharacterized protein LOC122292343 n=1 Tax=Carya illinoinensis TaxID=32201 RepID=UPI001C720364|nr:uncharacterized protein LOC122292343 [Carya illinoinensis]